MFQTISNTATIDNNFHLFEPLDIFDSPMDFSDSIFEGLEDELNNIEKKKIPMAVTSFNEEKHTAPTEVISDPSISSSVSKPSPLKPDKKNSIVSEDIDPFDILCGREKKSQLHLGNRRFRIIIEMNRLAYKNAPSKDHKMIITFKVVSTIRSCGIRFLKENETTPGHWYDVGDILAREKVSHALRNAKDPNRPRLPKKQRKPLKKYIPTPKEDIQFQKTLEEQSRIYQTLLEQEAKKEEGMTMNIEDLLQECRN